MSVDRKRTWRSIASMTPVRWLAVAVFALLIAACSLPGPTPILNPPAQPFVDCVGVAPDVCEQAVRDARLSAPAGSVVVRIQVRCTVQVCIAARGQSEVNVQYSDGSTGTYGSAWEQAVPGGQAAPPVLPVQPICIGVPPERCHETALGAMPVPDGRPAVLSIVVRCTRPSCTDVSGQGDMVVTYADGTTTESSWGYEN